MTAIKRHILFLTDNFPPEINAPASRTIEHCREWVRLGHEVTVVTSNPNFPEGRLYPGFKNRLWRSERYDGLRVIRVWTYIAPNVGFTKRIIDFLSYMVMGTIAGLFVRRVDVVVGTSPHLFVTVAAMVLGAVKRIPYVFELRDLWPESIKTVGAMEQGRIFDWLERLELFLYRRADLIVAVTKAFRANLIERGIDGAKVKVITNGADLSRFKPGAFPQELACQLGVENAFVAGYIGTHGVAHGLTTLLDAAEIVASQGHENLVILFIGAGAERQRLIDEAQRRRLINVRFLDPVSKDRIVEYWRLLDAAVIHVRDHPLFVTVIPSKTFEAMAVGVPILHGVRGESADIVRTHEVGVVFEPENASELARLLLELKDQPELRKTLSRNGVAAAPDYDRAILARRMLREIEALLTPGRENGA